MTSHQTLRHVESQIAGLHTQRHQPQYLMIHIEKVSVFSYTLRGQRRERERHKIVFSRQVRTGWRHTSTAWNKPKQHNLLTFTFTPNQALHACTFFIKDGGRWRHVQSIFFGREGTFCQVVVVGGWCVTNMRRVNEQIWRFERNKKCDCTRYNLPVNIHRKHKRCIK